MAPGSTAGGSSSGVHHAHKSGGSSKASQMLGMTYAERDMFMSQGGSSSSREQSSSPPAQGRYLTRATGGGGSGRSLPPPPLALSHHHNQQHSHGSHVHYGASSLGSPGSSGSNQTGSLSGSGYPQEFGASASYSGGGQQPHGNTSGTSPQSHTRMTLKKARSLFSNGGKSSKSSSPSNANEQRGPMGMGSYGNNWSPPPPLPGSSSNGQLSASSSHSSALNHSKSYGSLHAAAHSQSGLGYSSNRTPPGNMTLSTTSPPLPPLPGQYAASAGYSPAARKASLPNLDPNGRFEMPPYPFGGGEPGSTSGTTHRGGRPSGGATGGLAGNAREQDDDAICPICLEPLSIRLEGEKPLVVPLCGHRMHNECFEAAYETTVREALREAEARAEGGLSARRKNKSAGAGTAAAGVVDGKAGQANAPLTVCKICRADMVLGDPADASKSKFASMFGQGGRGAGVSALDTHKVHSLSKQTIDMDDFPEALGGSSRGRSHSSRAGGLHDPSEDQDVLNPHQLLPAYMQHLALGPNRTNAFPPFERVLPKISVRAEHTSLARSSDHEKTVHLTCLVTVEIPSRVPLNQASSGTQQPYQLNGLPASSSNRSLLGHNVHGNQSQSTILGYQPGQSRSRSGSNTGSVLPTTHHSPHVSGARRESNARAHTHGTDDFPTSPSNSNFSAAVHAAHAGASSSHTMDKTLSSISAIASTSANSQQTPATTASAGFTPNTGSTASFDGVTSRDMHYSNSQTGSGGHEQQSSSGPGYDPAFNASAVTLTTAAQEEKTREAHGPFADVYKDLQDRMADWKGHQPSNFGSLRMYDLLAVKKDKNVREFVVYLFEEALLCVVDDRKKTAAAAMMATATTAAGETDRLRLKGRVFVKHMRQVEDTSSMNSGLSLTIHMEDDSLENFVILFPHRDNLEVWRSQIQALIDHHRPPIPSSSTKTSLATSGSRRDSVFSDETNRSGQSSYSRGTKGTTATSVSGSGPVPEGAIPPVPALKKSMQSINSALAYWTPPDPATFVPLDLMLVFAVPAASSSGGPSSNELKLRLIKSTLDFIVHSAGPRARISIVAYTTGDAAHATVRKTPWLATGRADGMKRLEQAIADLAGERGNRYEEGLVSVDPKEEKVTVVTAVNLALDIVLQRSTKSSTCGMIVLNDGRDGSQKHQIDLLLARSDAARVSIHTFGWGKHHDPSSLWLLSNHTKGTYTFVDDYYKLKEAIAGCIGGLLCVAVNNLRLHLNVQERRWFKIRKVAGVATAIVSSDGKDVDIGLGELRFGEKKEMLVEVEMASPRETGASPRSSSQASGLARKKSMTATDDFFLKKVGVDPHSFGDDLGAAADFYDEIEDGMADDVPVFDVNASFKNPQDPASELYKLPYPSLLTITVTPPGKGSNSASSGAESPQSASASQGVSDATIVRRRMELLTSDMITRTLLLMSRRQDAHAARLLTETTRIFAAISANLVPPSMSETSITPETRYANEVLQACVKDVEEVKKGCTDRAVFDTVTRNFGAQQAVALRDQRAWTNRTATEALFFCPEWTALFGKALSGAY